MSLNVSYNQIQQSGIDTTALKTVTQQIFQKSGAKVNSVLANNDLTQFNRVSLGTDLYSGKVQASTANQIAMNKVDYQVNLSDNAVASLKYLNSQASQSVFKTVEGKITLPEVQEVSTEKKSFKLPSFGQLVETADLGSDKQGSNPFYKGELLKVKKEDKEEETLDLVA